LSSALESVRVAPEARANAQRLAILGELFKAWPAARTWSFSESELDLLQSDERPQRTLTSAAGSLVFWAVVLEQLGFDKIYANRRQLNAVYWVLGRALERPALSSQDPLLAIFGGEEPGAPLALETTLRETDSEPLQTIALSLAAQLAATAPLKVVPFGSDALLVAEGCVILDSLANTAPHDALPSLVKRLRSRTGQAPASLEVADTLSDDELEMAANSDAPITPPDWRNDLRSVVSILRYYVQNAFNVAPLDLQGWPALIHEAATIELRLRDVGGVGVGDWVVPGLKLGGVSYQIVVR
jgi:hypothetical protein